MNKILLNHQTNRLIINEDKKIELEIKEETCSYEFIVKEGIVCEILLLGNNSNINIETNQEANSSLKIMNYLENSNLNYKGNLLDRESSLEFIYSTINNISSKNNISIYHNNSNTKSYVYCTGVSSSKAGITFDVSGHIPQSSDNCICFQDSKIIELENSHSQINPNLYIENYNVEASHSAYIGPFQEQELFYLQSRGIPYNKAIQILIKAILLGKLNLSEEKKSELIQKIERYY